MTDVINEKNLSVNMYFFGRIYTVILLECTETYLTLAQEYSEELIQNKSLQTR